MSSSPPRPRWFSNIKAWLVGTHHGVSAKHLPRYLREWSYRFNRRNLPDGLDGYLIRRAVECPARLRALSNYSRVISGSASAGTDAPAPARVTLPSDLPGSLKYLDDAQLQRLSKAVAVEINRRNPAPAA